MGENSYFRAAALSLLYIRVIIFVKVQHRWKVTHVKTSKCATGIANLIGNKGGGFLLPLSLSPFLLLSPFSLLPSPLSSFSSIIDFFSIIFSWSFS